MTWNCLLFAVGNCALPLQASLEESKIVKSLQLQRGELCGTEGMEGETLS